MDTGPIVKMLREAALIRSSKDLSPEVKDELLAQMHKRIAELSRQQSLPLGAQVTNMKAK